nr:MFS transporter [Rhodococcus wratislaviensis]GLK33336.1 MFS transporter [Rhodococcus wratislaviensis]
MPTEQRADLQTRPHPRSEIRRVALSSYIGSMLEYYDFLLYGTAAAIVFGPVFFDELSSAAGAAAALATFAAGYIARPLGGIIFGHMGDRVGRKSVLIISLSVMGVTSLLIGLVPPSESIGPWAPAALLTLRIIQGIALGGEWGGAVLMAMEHAHPRSRGFVASFAYAGAPSGALLGMAAMACASMLPEQQFLEWGWRIPFLLSGVLLVVGLYLRTSVEESPVFIDARKRNTPGPRERTRTPLSEALGQWRVLLSVSMSGIAGFALQSTMVTFAITFAVSSGGQRPAVLLASALSQAVGIFSGLAFAKLSDLVGRRPVMVGGVAGAAVLLYPFFLLLQSGMFIPTLLGFVSLTLCLTAIHGPLPAFITEQFGTMSRYTGSSLGYQIATLLGGGLAPLAVTAIYAATETALPLIAIFIVGICLVSALAILRTQESKDNDLSQIGQLR